MSFSERLKLAMENAGYTQGRLAKEAGMAQSSVWRLVSGGAEGSRNAVKIANKLGVRPEWLTSGTGEMYEGGKQPANAVVPVSAEQLYRVDSLNLLEVAGEEHSQSIDYPENIKSLVYSMDQARLMFGNRPASNIRIITVKGESMAATIEPDDQVFLDITVKRFDGDGVYFFTFGKSLLLKRLQTQKNAIAVISDNSAYQPWLIEKQDEEQFSVIGRAVLRQRIDYKRFI